MYETILKKINEKKKELLDVLLEIENKNVAEEEIKLSTNALKNSTKYLKENNLECAAYLPMNLPLYSLVTYVIIPNVKANKFVYRPSTKVMEQSKKIHDILELDQFNISLIDLPRYHYFNKYVSKSDVIIFVGKPENADNLKNKLKTNSMMIYFGVGQNPIIVEKDANIKLTCERIVDAVLFNYGQDCAKPNVILVNKEIEEKLVKEIIKEIEKRSNSNKTTIKDLEVLKEVASLLTAEKRNIIHGGTIDFFNGTMDPIVISRKMKVNKNIYDEFYAPVFRIMVYDNTNDLKKYFSEKKYKDENMNISLFGTNNYVENLSSSIILNNSIVSDYDNGFNEFGGFGKNVSFVRYNGIQINKPLLINREIEQLFDSSVFNKIEYDKKINKLKQILYQEVKDSITDIFANDLLFSFIFGSYAKGSYKQTSDVDIFGCVNKIDTEMMNKFKEWYFKFHYKYGLFPDFLYPGEIITRDRLEEIKTNNYNVEFSLLNSSEVFDSIFYTQILTDKKTNIIGDIKMLLNYEIEFRKFIQEWCNQIYELLKKENMIKTEREDMKCLVALANSDLLYFSKKLKYEEPNFISNKKIINDIDDGFLMKMLRKNN